MTNVTIRIFGELYQYMPNRLDQATVDIPPKADVDCLLKQLGMPAYAVWVVTVNGQRVNREHLLREGDKVDIFAPIGGG